jgi:hypothetical protein
MQNRTPEQLAADVAKAQATRRANREKRKAEEELMRLHASNLYRQIQLLEKKLAKLETHEAMQALSNKITGKSLLREEQIIDSATPWQTASGVYFLVDGDRVVYVGQSVNIYSRIPYHHDKKFDKYVYIPCDPSQLNVLESLYIHLLQPKLNYNDAGTLFVPLTLNKLLEQIHDMAVPPIPKPKRQRHQSAEVQP